VAAAIDTVAVGKGTDNFVRGVVKLRWQYTSLYHHPNDDPPHSPDESPTRNPEMQLRRHAALKKGGVQQSTQVNVDNNFSNIVIGLFRVRFFPC
jgi:hypothetical protein